MGLGSRPLRRRHWPTGADGPGQAGIDIVTRLILGT